MILMKLFLMHVLNNIAKLNKRNILFLYANIFTHADIKLLLNLQ